MKPTVGKPNIRTAHKNSILVNQTITVFQKHGSVMVKLTVLMGVMSLPMCVKPTLVGNHNSTAEMVAVYLIHGSVMDRMTVKMAETKATKHAKKRLAVRCMQSVKTISVS